MVRIFAENEGGGFASIETLFASLGIGLHELRPGITDSAALLGIQLSTIDLSDWTAADPLRWSTIGMTGVLWLISARRVRLDQKERDVHCVVLSRDEKEESEWLLWSLCPNAARSTALPLRGSEDKVRRIADYFWQGYGAGRLEEMAADIQRRMRLAGAEAWRRQTAPVRPA